jgi:hypothetical protein
VKKEDHTVERRQLGRSGMLVSEIAYGDRVTHGSHIDPDAAIACVHAALDVGITMDEDLLVRVDDFLGPVLERDPSRIDVCEKRP